MKDLHKILTTLNLSSSDTREDTLISIIKTTLFVFEKAVDYNELVENINLAYEVQLYEIELKELLRKLVAEQLIILEYNKYALSPSEKQILTDLNTTLVFDESKRFENFKTLIEEKFNLQLKHEELKKLWAVFIEYLYSCFYHYGTKAIEYFHPGGGSRNISSNAQLFNEALNKLKNTSLSTIFKSLVDNFADYATLDDINFINELGQKTLAFASLGLNPEESKENFDKALIDWVLYLDTNFLFSILDLHINPETESCNELLKLVFNNQEFIKIKFRYSELTQKELRDKKKDFENLDSALTKSAIKALLKSDNLDDFHRQYYQNLLTNPIETIHPTNVIDLSEKVLSSKKIEISRNKKRIENLNETYINLKIQDYQKYIEGINEIRENFAQEKKTRSPREFYRSDSQKKHDITLRELILDLRGHSAVTPNTFNEVKYYGITLDELLIRYDAYEIGKSGIKKYPTFFKPSFLLNRLVKILPVKTDNYKKAFIKAVSAKGFNKDIRQSNDIIKIVSYLRRQGIDNEDILLNLINEKLFLETFKENSNKDNFDENSFFEAEINKLYEKKIQEANQAIEKIEEYENKINESKIENKTIVEEKEKLIQDKVEIVEKAELLELAVKQLQRKVTILEKSKPTDIQSTIFKEIEAQKKEKENREKDEKIQILQKEKQDLENDFRLEKLKIFYKQKIYNWRLKTWIIFGVFTVCILAFLGILYYNNKCNLKATNTFIKSNPLVNLSLWIIGLIYSGVLVKILVDKYFNHSNIKAYKEGIEIPKDLKPLK